MLKKMIGKTPLRRTVFLAAICLIVLLAGTVVYFKMFRSGVNAQNLLSRETAKLEQIVQKNPEQLDARVRLAMLYHAAGNDRNAISQLESVLQQNKNYQGALIALGDLYIDTGRYQEALDPYGKVIELNKETEMRGISRELEGVYYHVGVAQVNLKKTDQAIASFTQALGIDKTDADAWYMMGTCYLNLKDWQNALDCFNIAVQFVPEFKAAYEGMAQGFKQTGQTNLANYAAGMAEFSAGNNVEAIKQLEKVISAAPDFAEAHLGVALAYEKDGQTAKAAEAFAEARRLKPELWLADAKLKTLGGN